MNFSLRKLSSGIRWWFDRHRTTGQNDRVTGGNGIRDGKQAGLGRLEDDEEKRFGGGKRRVMIMRMKTSRCILSHIK